MALTTQQVETLYLAYLGRKGSAEEVALWQTLEITQEFAATGFYNSPEAQARGLTDNATYINQIYNDLFNRDAETAGLNAWLQLLANGFPRDQIALAIANTALSNPSGADGQTLQAAISDVPPGPGPGPEPTPGATFMLTEGVDYADADKSTHDDVADPSGFKFTDTANEQITTTLAQLGQGDKLVDLSNNDNDVITINLTIDDDAAVIDSNVDATLVNIEEIVINSRGAKNATFNDDFAAAGLKTLKITGAFLDDNGSGFTFTGGSNKTLATIDASAITAGNVDIDASKATQDLTITGPNSAAVITGGAGNDNITGGAGKDTINGGDGNDVINAGAGNDSIIGGAGKDTINGGDGDDVITGGAGADVLTGGAGADKFVFKAATESTKKDLDIIKDFSGNKAGSGQGDKIAIAEWTETDVIGNATDLVKASKAKTLDDALTALEGNPVLKAGEMAVQTFTFEAVDASKGQKTLIFDGQTATLTTSGGTSSDGHYTAADVAEEFAKLTFTNWIVTTTTENKVTVTTKAAEKKDAQVTTGDVAVTATVNKAGSADTKLFAAAKGAAWFEFGGNTYVIQDTNGNTSYESANDLIIKLTGTKLGLEAGDFEAAA